MARELSGKATMRPRIKDPSRVGRASLRDASRSRSYELSVRFDRVESLVVDVHLHFDVAIFTRCDIL